MYSMAEIEDSDYWVSDEEISTNKERHSRLGEDNLDDTLEYDFAGECLKVKKIEDVNAKKSDVLNDQNIGQEVEAEKFPGSRELIVSDPLTPIPNTQACVPYCGFLNPCISYLKAEKNANIKESITDLEREENIKNFMSYGSGNK